MDSLGVASDPRTPAAALEALSREENPEVVRAVAANPNTPVDTLWRLAALFPQEVTGNPTLEFVLMEDPGALRKQSLPVHLALAGCPSTPHPWLAMLAEASLALIAPDLAFRLAANPSTPPEDLARFCCHRNRHVRALAVANPSAPAGWLDLLERAGSQSHGGDFGDMGGITVAEAHQIEAAGFWGKMLLARHPDTPPEIRWRLARSVGWEAWSIAQQVAACPFTPPDILRTMVAEGKCLDLLATNPSLPPPLLDRLSRDPGGAVRSGVAKNPATPGSILRILTTERDRAAAAAALENPGLDAPWRALVVKAGLSATPGRPSALEADEIRQLLAGGVRARLLVATLDQTPFPVLESRLSDPSLWVRGALAGRRDLADSLRARLIADHEPAVRAALAARADLGPGWVARLLTDPHPLVLCRLAANLALSDEQVSRALTALLARKIPGDKHERQSLLDSLLSRPAGPALLARLLPGADPKLRGQIARHPRLPPGFPGLSGAPARG